MGCFFPHLELGLLIWPFKNNQELTDKKNYIFQEIIILAPQAEHIRSRDPLCRRSGAGGSRAQRWHLGQGTELQYEKVCVLPVTHFGKHSFPPRTPCIPPAAHSSLPSLLLWRTSLLRLYRAGSCSPRGSKEKWKPSAGTSQFTMKK